MAYRYLKSDLMNDTSIFINAFALVCLLYAFHVDRNRTKKALIKAANSFVRILPTILTIIVFIGLLLGFIPPAKISAFIGEQSGIGGVLLVAVMGSFLHIPALIAFPLTASLLDAGATVTTAAAFITTLTMVGVVTLPLEIREMGRKMALLRNGISFCIAIMIAVLMGLIL